MVDHAYKIEKTENQSAANSVSQKQYINGSDLLFTDNRHEAVVQGKLQNIANSSPQVNQLKAFNELPNMTPRSPKQDVTSQHKADNSNEVIQLAHYASSDPVYMNDDDPTSELLDDNFDDTIKNKLHQPTADNTVKKAVDGKQNKDVILWRSTTGASVAAIKKANSAGGAAVNNDAVPPGHDVQQDQIGVGGVVPEYTASQDVTGFSWRHWLVVVKINSKYLARGSANESGWICSPAAPVEVLDTVDRTLGLPEPKGVGAA